MMYNPLTIINISFHFRYFMMIPPARPMDINRPINSLPADQSMRDRSHHDLLIARSPCALPRPNWSTEPQSFLAIDVASPATLAVTSTGYPAGAQFHRRRTSRQKRSFRPIYTRVRHSHIKMIVSPRFSSVIEPVSLSAEDNINMPCHADVA